MFALPTTLRATQPLPAIWQAANGHVCGLSEGGLSEGGLLEGSNSGLFLSDSSALRPEGHT